MDICWGNHWPKLPTLARHHSNHLHELSYTEGPGKKFGTIITGYHQLEEFGKGQKERRDSSPFVLPTSQNPFWPESLLAECCTHHQERLCVRMIGQRSQKPTHNHKTWDSEQSGRAVLLGSLTLLNPAQVSLPSKASCFVSACVSSDNSLPSVRQAPTLQFWKGLPLHVTHLCCFHIWLLWIMLLWTLVHKYLCYLLLSILLSLYSVMDC